MLRKSLDRQALIATGLWVLAALVFVHTYHNAIGNASAGIDFDPLRHAGQALRENRSIYSDPDFIYPPTAAPVFLPLTVLSRTATLHAWIALGMIFLAIGITLAVRSTGTRWLVFAPVVVGILLGGPLGLSLGNLSLLLVLAAVGIVILYESDQWTAGTTLLVICLLIKPVLAPLILLPIVARQWKALAVTAVPGAVVLIIAIFLVPGGNEIHTVFDHVLGGGHLHGDDAQYNLSLRGLSETHPGDLLLACTWFIRGITAAVVGWCFIKWARSTWAPGSRAAAGGLLMAGLFLCGSISETHFIFILFGISIVGMRSSSRTSICLMAFSLVLAAIPDYLLTFGFSQGHAIQVRYIILEYCLLAACAVGVIRQEKGGEAAGHLGSPPAAAERARPWALARTGRS